MTNFIVCSQANMPNQVRAQTEPFMVVSITSPEDPPATIPENPKCFGLVRLAFDDVSGSRPPPYFAEQYKPFTEELAKFLLMATDIYTKQYNVNTIIVHCLAGMSRSAGVAAALSRLLNDDDEIFFEQRTPNMLVYSTILRTAYTENILA